MSKKQKPDSVSVAYCVSLTTHTSYTVSSWLFIHPSISLPLCLSFLLCKQSSDLRIASCIINTACLVHMGSQASALAFLAHAHKHTNTQAWLTAVTSPGLSHRASYKHLDAFSCLSHLMCTFANDCYTISKMFTNITNKLSFNNTYKWSDDLLWCWSLIYYQPCLLKRNSLLLILK